MWNYRVVKKKIPLANGTSTNSYGLYEVYYNKNGDAWCMSSQPVGFCADYCDSDSEGVDEIIQAMEMAIRDASEHPIFEEPETWAPDDNELEGTIKIKDQEDNISEFYCPKCGGQVHVWYQYEFNPEEEKKTIEEFFKDKDKIFMCYECHEKLELPEGTIEIEEERSDI